MTTEDLSMSGAFPARLSGKGIVRGKKSKSLENRYAIGKDKQGAGMLVLDLQVPFGKQVMTW